jgi:hypothetical protein
LSTLAALQDHPGIRKIARVLFRMLTRRLPPVKLQIRQQILSASFGGGSGIDVVPFMRAVPSN